MVLTFFVFITIFGKILKGITVSVRMVKCIKLGEELPGLKSPPTPSELGRKIFENVSQKAWDEFLEYFKMVINEYRLDLTSPLADQIFEQKMEEYFFSGDARMPEGFIPPKKT